MRRITRWFLLALLSLAGASCRSPDAVPPGRSAAMRGPSAPPPALSVQQIAPQIIALERAALNRWAKGDPNGFLEISAPDVTYFDPAQEQRLDGLQALTFLYLDLHGNIKIDRFEMLNPMVQLVGDAAILTYNFLSVSAGQKHIWNCTEVYRRQPDGWRIIHTHWSMNQSNPS